VICCDGTGNEVTSNHSNVLKLFRMLEKGEAQRVYYDPGVGTIGADDEWKRRMTRFKMTLGLVTGAGLDDNVLDAYRFLATVYEPGDRVYLFGFSRGAYTVRELAGFLHMVGLLRPDRLNLCDYALTAYKRAGERSERVYEKAKRKDEATPDPAPAGGCGPEGERSDALREATAESAGLERDDTFWAAWQFGKVMGTRHVPIHFMGCWDTVASMIVPGNSISEPFKLRTLPYTRFNPSVRAFRHAMAIDERRRMFRLNRWKNGQEFVENPFSDPPVTRKQDSVQRWFAGVHSDIGGGYPEEESSLSKLPLIWMVDEARAHGLRVDQERFDRLASNVTPPGSPPSHYAPPDPCGPMHRSLHGIWWVIEWLPKSARWREWETFFALYFPGAEPRPIPPDPKDPLPEGTPPEEAVHPSVFQRTGPTAAPPPPQERIKGLVYPPYDPPNLRHRRDLPDDESRWAPLVRPIGVGLYLLFLAAILWLVGDALRAHPMLDPATWARCLWHWLSCVWARLPAIPPAF